MDRFVVGYTLRCSIRCRQLLFGVALASIWLSRPATLGSGVRPLRHDSYAVYCPQFDENTHLHTHTPSHTHTHGVLESADWYNGDSHKPSNIQ